MEATLKTGCYFVLYFRFLFFVKYLKLEGYIFDLRCFFLNVCLCWSFSHVWLFLTPWTVTHQAPLSMAFSRQGHRSKLPCPSPGDLPDPRIEPRSPVLQVDYLLFETLKHSYTCSSKSCFRCIPYILICCVFIFIYLKVLSNFFDYSGVCYLLSKYI